MMHFPYILFTCRNSLLPVPGPVPMGVPSGMGMGQVPSAAVPMHLQQTTPGYGPSQQQLAGPAEYPQVLNLFSSQPKYLKAQSSSLNQQFWISWNDDLESNSSRICFSILFPIIAWCSF